MGDFSLDFTKNKKFLALPYSCAAIGAVAAALSFPAATAASTIGIAAAGAVAGGIGLPVIGFIGLVGALSVGKIFKSGVGGLKNDWMILPLGVAVLAANCAQALFVMPFSSLAKTVKKTFPTAKAKNDGFFKPADPKESRMKDASSQTAFNDRAATSDAEQKPAPESKKQTTPEGQKP